MIPQIDASLPHLAALPGTAPARPMAPVPAWLRRAVADTQSLSAQGIEDVAAAAGAAIGALDALVRCRQPWAGAWRQRLALAAAAVTAMQAGRVEDEAALRDAVLLTRPGGSPSANPANPGPAGLLLRAWRWLAMRPVEDLLTARNLGAMLEEFGYAADGEAASDLAGELRLLSSGGMVGMLGGAFAAAERYGFSRAVGAWLADALVARRLGWPQALPLLGGEAAVAAGRSRRQTPAVAANGVAAGHGKSLLAAQARAALRAIDLSAELGRRADALLAAAPKLRARGADAVVARLLEEDALAASRGERLAGMSDRGLRRLFDRLVELGAVRELSGRSTFRIYGL